MTSIVEKIKSVISNENDADNEIINKLYNLIIEYEFHNNISKEPKPILDVFKENIKSKKHDENSIKTGFKDIDQQIGGLSLGEFVVIGGRPAIGKTLFQVNLAINISKTIPVLFFSFDLSEHLLTSRIIAAIATTPASILVKDTLQLEAVEHKLKDHKIFINDNCNHAFLTFKKQCKTYIEQYGVKIIFIDYLQMISSNKFRNNREQEVSHICRELKNIAKDYNVCVIATSQLSRAVETRGGDKRPQLSDLRESGAIEQDADKIFFIYRPDYYGLEQDCEGNNTHHLVEIDIAKNKNGPLASIKLKRDGFFTHVYDFDGYYNEFSISSNRLNEIETSN